MLNSEQDPAIQLILINRTQKDTIVEVLQLILEAGMYMRGWSGPPMEYRLEDCIVEVNQTNTISLRVTQALARLENRVNELGELGTQIMNLPLFKHNDGRYVRSTESADGATIGERIDIIKRNTSIKSCIRMSSNWLCSSAHKYILLISGREVFTLTRLRYIS